MISTSYTKTKRELFDALNTIKIQKIQSFDINDPKVTAILRQPKKQNMRTTVVFVDELIKS